MEATQNTEITVPGGTPFGVPGTNLQVWLGKIIKDREALLLARNLNSLPAE
jgi:hypothetical protein